MKNRGFTLVELLAVIVILGILTIGAISAVSTLIEKSREDQLIQQKETLIEAAKSYVEANSEIKPKEIGKTTDILASTLREEKYLKEDLKNSKDKSCMKYSYAEVKKTSTSNYQYKAYLYCGKEEPKNKDTFQKPVIEVKFVNNTDEVSNSFSSVQEGKAIINIKGSKNDKTIGIESYNYILYSADETMTKKEDLHEVYNSGNVDGFKKPTVEVVQDLKDYINIIGKTMFYIKVVAINTLGEEAVYENNSSIMDIDPPTCKLASKPVNENDWLGKRDIVNNKKQRSVSVYCEDGNGSGCIRNKFTKTWPNSDSAKSLEFGYITIKDNAGNQNSCKVRVNIDQELPTIEVTSPLLNKKYVSDDKNNNITIESNSYNNLSNGWLNKEITFNINLSDNVKLIDYEWKTNGSNENQKGQINAKSKTITIALNNEGNSRSGTLTVRDIAGNTNTVTIKAKIDRTKPICGAKTRESTTWAKSRTVGIKCSDSLSDCSKSEFTTPVKAGGKTANVSIVISDKAGNQETCTKKYKVYIDNIPPKCGSKTGGSTKWSNAENRTVGVKCTDGQMGCKKEKFNKKVEDEVKTKNVTITIKDKAGNTATCKNKYDIYLDRTPPTIYTGAGDKIIYFDGDNHWGFKVKDNLSGVATISSPQQGKNGPSEIYYCYGSCYSACNTSAHDSNAYKLGNNLPKVLTNKEVYKYWLRQAQIADNVDGINGKDSVVMDTYGSCNGGAYLVRTATKMCDLAGNCTWKEINYDFR